MQNPWSFEDKSLLEFSHVKLLEFFECESGVLRMQHSWGCPCESPGILNMGSSWSLENVKHLEFCECETTGVLQM